MISSSWVSVAPIRLGGGTRLKILEAMALSTPVVTTSKGVEGLEVQHNVHVLIADSPEAFAEQIIRLSKDNGLRQRLVENAYQLVCEKYNWSVVMPRFLDLVEKTASQ
jgi:glycosyltransferase involved in cell wall biosynthesis